MKYCWKRIPHKIIMKIHKDVCNRFGKGEIGLGEQTSELGVDESGRDVRNGVVYYVEILKKRGVKVHTVLVLGSRAKGRSKPDSDVDVLIVASDLPGRTIPIFPSLAQKILGIRRWFLLSDWPICMGIEPSGCCSKEEFLQRLEDFELEALDAMYYGKIVCDDGFWLEANKKFKEIEEKYEFDKKQLKRMLLPL